MQTLRSPPVDGRPVDPQRTRNLCVGPSPSLLSCFTRAGSIRRLVAFVGDPLQLPFPPQVGFELREHAEHVEEALASRGAGVDRLLCRPSPAADRRRSCSGLA